MKNISILAVLLVASGCQESLTRSDLIESSHGNSIASASAMQTVDPWQRYVYDTNLETSSQRQALARAKYDNGGVLPKEDPVPQTLMPFPFPIPSGQGTPPPVTAPN